MWVVNHDTRTLVGEGMVSYVVPIHSAPYVEGNVKDSSAAAGGGKGGRDGPDHTTYKTARKAEGAVVGVVVAGSFLDQAGDHSG